VYGPQQGVSVDGRTAYTFDGDNDYIVTADSALDLVRNDGDRVNIRAAFHERLPFNECQWTVRK